MSLTSRSVTLAAFGVVAAFTLGACAGGGEDNKAAGTTESTRVASTEGATATLAVEAHEFSLAPKDLRTTPGSVAIQYTNAGVIQHTLLIDGVSGFKLD